MRIQDLENRTGLERATIRFYEREGLLNPKRSDNGYREYGDEEADQLMKIKLLRQLGMSVGKIKALQQGDADFSSEMNEQIRLLTAQIGHNMRAREVCIVIRSDGVDYKTMNAEHYLNLLQEIPVGQPLVKKSFQEDIPEEIHPWRRYIARSIDAALFSLAMQLVIFVLFRVRPIPEEFFLTLMGIGFGFLYIPVEALMLNKWGTTPGKWAMGIRLEWIQGGNLPYLEALYRSWRVLKCGMGFGVPLVELGFMSYCHAKLTGRPINRWQKYNEIDPPAEMDWDDDTEIIYSEWEGKWKLRLLPLAAVWVLLAGIAVSDMVRPPYRGADLTVSQFAANYNSTLRLWYENPASYDKLQPDGTKEPIPENTAVINVDGKPDKKQASFAYETEESFIRTVSFENSWSDVLYLMPLNDACYNAAVSVLLAQDGCSLQELAEFTEIWEKNQGDPEASIRYKNIEIQWQITYENCTFSEGILFREFDVEESCAQVRFVLKIHKV